MEQYDQQLFEQYKKYIEEAQAKGLDTPVFRDQLLQNMKKNLDPEVREYYEQIGKHMYGYDYETDGKLFQMKLDAEHAIRAVQMGLRIKDLKEEEVLLLKNYLGDDWEQKIEDYVIEN
jgi:hypothetical protein